MPTFFASDFHFGVAGATSSRERELSVVRWLDYCLRERADAIYLVGDLFEFWFEWKHAVPRGHVRFLGKLAEVVDSGTPLHVFTGNHDLWMQDYLEEEVGATVHREPVRHAIYGKHLLIGHGDGLGPGDYGYKRLKKLMSAGWAQWLYGRLHPNFSIGLANWFSGKSRDSQPSEAEFLGPDAEWLVAYSEEMIARHPELDYLIFGHRHLPIDYRLSNGRSRYLNLGEWLNYRTYVRLDASTAELLSWESTAPAPPRPAHPINWK